MGWGRGGGRHVPASNAEPTTKAREGGGGAHGELGARAAPAAGFLPVEPRIQADKPTAGGAPEPKDSLVQLLVNDCLK